MIVLTGSVSEPKWTPIHEANPFMGMMLAPDAWRFPWCQHYACDNGAFGAWKNSLGPCWWEEKGEARWFKMLSKIPQDHKPLFCTLPDVVGDWEETKYRASLYGPMLKQLGLRSAIALQEGCEKHWHQALDYGTEVIFVGGDKAWKWFYVQEITEFFQAAGKWVHVGRVNGRNLVRRCKQLGVDSIDGTGFSSYSDEMIPPMLEVMHDKEPQLWLKV